MWSARSIATRIIGSFQGVFKYLSKICAKFSLMPGLNEGYQESDFHRQRRNLIVGSVALLFVQVADLHLEKHGTVMGLPFTIGRPDALNWFLWAAVWYWGLRFFQFHQWRRPTYMQSAAREVMYNSFLPHALARLDPSERRALDDPFPKLTNGQTCQLLPHSFAFLHFHLSRI